MKITSVKINIIQPPQVRLKALASIVFDNELAIYDLQIIHNGTKFFVALPRTLTAQKNLRETIVPLNPSMRNYLEDVLLSAYEAKKGKNTK
ncbi:hypothetical protein AGMMS50284_4290 [Clostridia bacterium]|nr:hypothetical protein AGMMS50284_4290 [Clostridia bacterium]